MRYTDFPAAHRVAIAATVVLAMMPVLFSLVRLGLLSQGTMLQPSDARFIASPAPVALHVAGVSLFLVLGVLQLRSAGRPGTWHKHLGPLTALAGTTGALSGVWMVVFYAPGPDHSTLLDIGRLIFGTAMAGAIILATLAIWTRDLTAHKAWMIRAFAIASGVGTQILALALAELTFSPPAPIPYAILMIASWSLNLAVAEFVIARLLPTSRTTAQPERA